MNIVVVSTFRRPFATRLCLEAIARAQRWYEWADTVLIGVPRNAAEYPEVTHEILGVMKRNSDIQFQTWSEECESNPHIASKYLLDAAFVPDTTEATLYVEDDVVLSPDAFVVLDIVKSIARRHYFPDFGRIIGACLYHETIPEQYHRELRREPDPALLHLSNGINTCGGTMFLRDPYLEILAPNWNSKQVEPKGFDYSAHFQMYLNKLFMVYPDYSRSNNHVGWGANSSLSYEQWAAHFAKSIQVTEHEALKDPSEFRLSENLDERKIVRESWMEEELKARGLWQNS